MSSSEEGALPDHLIAIGHGWAAWRALVLRGAGFPAHQVLALGGDAVLPAIDALFAREAELERARAEVIAACAALLPGAEPAKPLRKRLDALRRGALPASWPDVPGLADAVAPVYRAEAARAEARRAVDAAYELDQRRISAALRERAHDPRFCEALTWQNRALRATMLEPLRRAALDARNSHVRQKEATVAGYVQRYCVKNDTIGFFGPSVWARIGDAAPPVQLRAGADLLDVRSVHFEYWAIDTLAAQLASDPAVRVELAPRRMPTVRIAGDVVHYPIARRAEIGADYLAALAACDGATPARAIAERLAGDPALAVSFDDVLGLLDELAEQRLIRWTIEIPTVGDHPERHLRRALTELPAGAPRDHALATLDALEAARAAIARAAGDADALDRALDALDAQFSALTGAAATRHAGKMYAGRTLIFEDTRRAVDVELGAGFLAKLAAPLELVMHSARWYTHAVAAAYQPVFHEVYAALRARTGDAEIDYLQYLEQIVPRFAAQGAVAPTVRPIVDELHRRWRAVLDLPADLAAGLAAGLAADLPAHRRRVTRTAAALRPAVVAAFAAPGPGWPQARYHAPDILVAAADLAAFARGDFTCVIGEVHTGVNTCTRPMFLHFHPDPERVLRARRHDLGRPVLTPVEARAHALRTDHFAPLADDLDLETSDAKSWRDRAHVIGAAELVITERAPGALCARTRDGRHTFTLVELFESQLQLASEVHFTLLPALAHTPRVAIDDVVIAREAWTFAADQLDFAAASAADRFVAVRRWTARHALPRFVFARVPGEPKPVYVDLTSPIYVESFTRLVAGAPELKLAEMLPAIDQTWLADAAGQTYTSELRMAIVDPIAWRPAL